MRLPWNPDYAEGGVILPAASVIAIVQAGPLRFAPHNLDEEYFVMTWLMLRKFAAGNLATASYRYGEPPWYDCDKFRDESRGQVIAAARRHKLPRMPVIGGIEFEYKAGGAHAQQWAIARTGPSAFQTFMLEPQRRGDGAWAFDFDAIGQVRRMEF